VPGRFSLLDKADPRSSELQHYDRRRLYDIALEKIQEAIKHTPTVPDLYLVKVGALSGSLE
jgi:hypothetical protein